MSKRITATAAALALSLSLGASAPRPASADGAASTRNIILGAAALVAGDIIYNNIHHKAVQHNTVVGYTRDGGTVYGDGHVTYPNGDVLYTGSGQNRCSYDGNYQPCGSQPVAYYPQGYTGHRHGRGHAYGNDGYGYNGYGNDNNGYGNNGYGNPGRGHDKDKDRGHGHDRGDDGDHGDHGDH